MAAAAASNGTCSSTSSPAWSVLLRRSLKG